MKKKILSGLFALALLATAGLGVHKSMKSDANLSDLALSNVEALADGEVIIYPPCMYIPWEWCIYLGLDLELDGRIYS
ncbi:NVEALA domain-containing protein [Proteiniphilum propionicum]|mgnify:CR=1 FL=1|jgi:hypothetical protein|uniref:NVEALA domain-containing protein n=1 Tax=Proteiniphilum propionicum TaxID=2829812 RepID=UPI001EEBA908|nr:NVEALA domain-containing protein [Proteiniphilum propionicum]ULB33776.1 hypothetical protein KDN43_12350 [Proteiniphilum propionicum]